MMRFNALAAAAALTLLSGCAGMAFTGRTGYGAIYADTKLPDQTSPNGPANKTGEACANSILGWVTQGDASVAAAAKAGGIRKIATVDNKSTNILGLYSTFCTVVTGE